MFVTKNFVDDATQAVLGTREFLARLTPDSLPGKEYARQLPTYFQDNHDAWRQEIQALSQTETWISQHPDDHRALRAALTELPGLERPLRKLTVLEPLRDVELFEVKRFLFHAITALKHAAHLTNTWNWPTDQSAKAHALMQQIHPQPNPSPRFLLSSALSPTLENLRTRGRNAVKQALDIFHTLEREITAQHGGHFDIAHNYQSSLTHDQLSQIPTLREEAGQWRLNSPELEAAELHARTIAALVDAEEEKLRIHLTDLLHAHIDWLKNLLHDLTILDIRLAKSRLRTDLQGCWPTWSTNPGLHIQQGCEPRTAQALLTKNQPIQPVDIHTDQRPTIIVGPNMGGKSVLLKLAGICQWAAQHALPIPATSFEFTPVNAIIYVGSEEPLAAETSEGLSSFGREIARLVQWWTTPAAPRLWLLDELGRGTHPDEGADIAAEIIHQLHQNRDYILAVTHFPALTKIPGTLRLRIRGLTRDIAFTPGTSIEESLQKLMDYTPVPTENTDIPRDARRIARALGLPLDTAPKKFPSP